MSAVAILPTGQSVDAAWERFQALARAVNDNPGLWMDRSHVEEMIVAHKAFSDAFLAMASKS